MKTVTVEINPKSRASSHSRRGSVLLLAMGFLLVMTLLIASLLSWASTETVMVSRRAAQVESQYGAEAAVRREMAQVRKLYFEGYSSNSYYTGSMAAPTDTQIAALSSSYGPTTVTALSNYAFSNVSIAFTSGSAGNRYVTNAIANGDETLSAFAGLTSQRATILCQAKATASNRRYSIPMGVQQQFNIDYIPVFQYAVFYNMDMEIFNGPTMTINGKVHANGTLYYAPAATLAVQAAVTTDGSIERGIKVWNSSLPTSLSSASASVQAYYNNSQAAYAADPANWANSVPSVSGYGTASFTVKNPSTGSQVDFQTSSSPLTYYDSSSSGWAGGALTRWGGGVKTKDQGINDVTPPVPDDVISAATDSTNPYHVIIEHPVLNSSGASTESTTTQGAKMGYNATLLIQRSGTNVIFRVKDAASGVYRQVALRDASTIVPIATDTLRDQREYLQNGNVKMTVTDFNIAALYGDSNADGTLDANHGAMDNNGNWMNASNAAITVDTSGNTFTPVPFDGTVYIYDDNFSSSRKPAIRIKNGAKIFDKDSNSDSTIGYNGNLGLSIISENPVYVQGNFNSDGNTSTGPEKTGASKENVPPAMIAADVLSVLSSSWTSANDDPASSSYFGRSGSVNTEINAAILAGVNRSDQSVVNSSFDGTTGGVNNFPRFLENWSSTFKYSGSMVALWYGAQSTSSYRGAGTVNNVFSAPTRDWSFNTDFLNPNKLPRGTPIIRVYTTSNWARF